MRDIHVTVFNQLRHLTEEESQQQGTNVRAVDVSIGHDDDVVVTQLFDIEFFAADTAAQCGDQCAHLGGGEHLVEARFLYVEDLTLERQDRLGTTVTALFGRAAGGVTLHNVEFGERRVFLLAVGEFAGQTGDIQRPFAACHFARLASRFTGTGSVDHLADNSLGLTRLFQQVITKVLVHFLLDRSFHLGRNQLVLGLRGEFGVRHFNRNNRGQTFTGIVTGGVDLKLFQQTFLLDVAVQTAGEGTAETGKVGAAIALGNVVGEAEDAFVEAVVPLHRHFYTNAIFTLQVEVEHRVDAGLVLVQVFNKGAQTTFVAEQLVLAGTLVAQVDAHTGVEERQFTQALGQDVPTEGDAAEGLGRRLEVNLGTGAVGVANLGQRGLRDAVNVGLFPHFAVAADG